MWLQVYEVFDCFRMLLYTAICSDQWFLTADTKYSVSTSQAFRRWRLQYKK